MPLSIAEKEAIHKLVNEVAKGIYGSSFLTHQARKTLSGTRDNLDGGVLTPLITEALNNPDGTSRINSLDAEEVKILASRLATACKDYQRETHVQLSTAKVRINPDLTVLMEEQSVTQDSPDIVLPLPQTTSSLPVTSVTTVPQTAATYLFKTQRELVRSHITPFLTPESWSILARVSYGLFRDVVDSTRNHSFIPRSIGETSKRSRLNTALGRIESTHPRLAEPIDGESIAPVSTQELDLSKVRDKSKFTDTMLIGLITNRPHITSMNLSGCVDNITEISIRFIAENCPKLESLNLYQASKISDISALAACKKLRILDLGFTQVNDLSALAACEELTRLNFSYTKVESISALAACKKLIYLNLYCTQVSDVSALEACEELESLDLSCTQVRGISALSACQKLKTLDLHCTKVSDVSALAACKKLKTLNLRYTQVSDVSALAACEELESFDLSGTQVKDISALAACTQLKTLDLSFTQVKDISALVACEELESLYLFGTSISDEAMQELYRSHPNKNLVIRNKNAYRPPGGVAAFVERVSVEDRGDSADRTR